MKFLIWFKFIVSLLSQKHINVNNLEFLRGGDAWWRGLETEETSEVKDLLKRKQLWFVKEGGSCRTRLSHFFLLNSARNHRRSSMVTGSCELHSQVRVHERLKVIYRPSTSTPSECTPKWPKFWDASAFAVDDGDFPRLPFPVIGWEEGTEVLSFASTGQRWRCLYFPWGARVNAIAIAATGSLTQTFSSSDADRMTRRSLCQLKMLNWFDWHGHVYFLLLLTLKRRQSSLLIILNLYIYVLSIIIHRYVFFPSSNRRPNLL